MIYRPCTEQKFSIRILESKSLEEILLDRFSDVIKEIEGISPGSTPYHVDHIGTPVICDPDSWMWSIRY